MLTPTMGIKKMTTTLFHDKDRVVYARVEKDFIDLLLSFLTLPLRSEELYIFIKYLAICHTNCASCKTKDLNVWCTDIGHSYVYIKTINPKYNGKQMTEEGGGYRCSSCQTNL